MSNKLRIEADILYIYKVFFFVDSEKRIDKGMKYVSNVGDESYGMVFECDIDTSNMSDDEYEECFQNCYVAYAQDELYDESSYVEEKDDDFVCLKLPTCNFEAYMSNRTGLSNWKKHATNRTQRFSFEDIEDLSNLPRNCNLKLAFIEAVKSPAKVLIEEEDDGNFIVLDILGWFED